MEANKKIGQRGKSAEADVRKHLEYLKQFKHDFDFERKYDARSARGRFPSQAGDYGFYLPGVHGLIEVKEVAHDFRLPQKNFSKDQIARCRMRELAGGIIVIIVKHTTTGLWRIPPFSMFRDYPTAPSWVLDSPTYPSAVNALENFERDHDYYFV